MKCPHCGLERNDIANHEIVCELQSKLDAARKLATLRADITKDQGQPGESESWRKLWEILK